MMRREFGFVPTSIQKLRQKYQEFNRDQKYLDNKVWQDFSAELMKSDHSTVMEFILQHGQENGYNHNLKIKYSRTLNSHENELKQLIQLFPKLNIAFQNYQELTKTAFDLGDYLTRDAIREYAYWIGRPGQFLLPCELAMVALAFDISIMFYTADDAKAVIFNEKPFSILTAVQFNGINHFERMVLPPVHIEKEWKTPSFLNMQALRDYLTDNLPLQPTTGTFRATLTSTHLDSKAFPLSDVKPEDTRSYDGCVTGLLNLSNNQLACIVGGTVKFLFKTKNFLSGFILAPPEGRCWASTISELPNAHLAAGFSNGEIKIWVVRSRAIPRLQRTLSEHRKEIRCVISLPDNKLISSSEDGTIKLWDTRTGICEKTLTDSNRLPHSLIVLSDGRLVSTSDENIKLWNLHTGLCTVELKGHTKYVRSLIELPNNKLVSCSYDNTIKIWNLKTNECEKTLNGHTAGIESIVLLSDGTTLASCSRDRTIKLWDLPSGQLIQTLVGHDSIVHQLAILPNGQLMSCSSDNTIKTWHCSIPKITKTEELTIDLRFLQTIRMQKIQVSRQKVVSPSLLIYLVEKL